MCKGSGHGRTLDRDGKDHNPFEGGTALENASRIHIKTPGSLQET